MSVFIVRDVRTVTGTSTEVLLSGREGLTLAATFHGTAGAHLFARMIGGLARAGQHEVHTEDGVYLVGSIGQMVEPGPFQTL